MFVSAGVVVLGTGTGVTETGTETVWAVVCTESGRGDATSAHEAPDDEVVGEVEVE